MISRDFDRAIDSKKAGRHDNMVYSRLHQENNETLLAGDRSLGNLFPVYYSCLLLKLINAIYYQHWLRTTKVLTAIMVEEATFVLQLPSGTPHLQLGWRRGTG